MPRVLSYADDRTTPTTIVAPLKEVVAEELCQELPSAWPMPAAKTGSQNRLRQVPDRRRISLYL
jgi:hypothetical protein